MDSAESDGTAPHEETGEQIPAFEEFVDMELDAQEGRRYMVLFDEDYSDFCLDTQDSLALHVDCNQAVEILKLASEVVADLAPEEAPDEDPIDAMIEALQEVRDDE